MQLTREILHTSEIWNRLFVWFLICEIHILTYYEKNMLGICDRRGSPGHKIEREKVYPQNFFYCIAFVSTDCTVPYKNVPRNKWLADIRCDDDRLADVAGTY